MLGLANVRGELLVCVSLGQVVGAEPLAAASHERRDAAYRRLLVIRRDGGPRRLSGRRSARHPPFPAAGIEGGARRPSRRRRSRYSTALLPWQGQSVGTLDDQLLFYTLKRSLE